MKRHYNIPIFIPHLGCPFQCIFCNQNKIASDQGIPAITEITAIIENHLNTISGKDGDVEIAFFGGSFTAIDRELQIKYLTAVQPYITSNRIQSIRVSTRPDFIDDSILSFLSKYGVKTIELGVQSLSDEVLKASGRGYSSVDVFKASHQIKSCGFKLGLQLMVGLPSDNYERDIDSTLQVISLKPDMVRIYPTLVITQTPLEWLYKEGKYYPLSLREAIATCKEMFLLFQKNEINVIRMGLQPGEELRSPGTVVAGPFHPSFGELVEQEVFKEQAVAAVRKYNGQAKMEPSHTLLVHEKDISKMVGMKKSNLLYLQDILGLKSIKVSAYSGFPRDTVAIGLGKELKPIFIFSRDEFLAER